ncbi:MAG: acetaldehyde dehydrogenase (acetylating) [Clostridia bacterium]|nr:acetaldehyde dehydrogenase (acetylating) [Clostridia bacterium]
MELDKDLASIQEARDLVRKAKAAQAVLAEMDQQQVDRIVASMARAAEKAARPLAQMAVKDTGFGREEDKVVKNLFAARTVYGSIKDKKTIGVIHEDREKKMLEVAIPVGVVAGLVPSTNPTSTTIFKALISVKAGNALIVSPHPSALNCIGEAVRILNAAAVEAGAPDGLVTMMTIPTIGGTAELMKMSNMIIATGGSAMVKAAYSSGTPALGVGPGNVPAYIERTADIPNAVRRIIASKTFDYGTICASEQSVVTESCIRDEVIAQFKRQGGYFVSGEEQKKLEAIIRRPGAETVNPRIVGRSARDIAALAGISVPGDTKVILCEQDGVGKNYPFSIEKLSPLLAFYTEPDWQHACERCLELLRYGGIGHSLSLHTNNPELVRTFVLKKPVSRLLVNTGSTQGGIGATTGISPSFTLGCGAVGGSATSDNVTVHHLYQIRRAAYGLIEPEDVSKAAGAGCSSCEDAPKSSTITGMSADEMERIVQAVVRQIRGA